MTSKLEVDAFALIHNVRTMRQVVGDLPMWAVVKANAYGHDMAVATEAFWRGGVNGWMTTDPSEAYWLSQQRYKLPVLLTTPLDEHLLSYAAEHQWQLGVVSEDYWHLLEYFSRQSQKPLSIQLEVETGMHRTGIPPLVVEQLLVQAANNPKISVKGLFTHLFHASDSESSEAQINIMRELQFLLGRKGVTVPPMHVLASEGVARYPDGAFEAVRLGKALFGFCDDFPETTGALTWRTAIIAQGEVKAGETVGYSATYRAQRTVRTATLAVGYSDGVDRRLSNKGFMLVQGKKCPIIGLVSMNHTVLDVSGLMKVEHGEEVVMLGKQRGAEISLRDIAEWTDISPYEFVTGINAKIKRVKGK